MRPLVPRQWPLFSLKTGVALWTDTAEFQVELLKGEAGQAVVVLPIRHGAMFDIEDGSTMGTGEVRVGAEVGLEVCAAVSSSEFDDQALFLEDVEVPVHRTQ